MSEGGTSVGPVGIGLGLFLLCTTAIVVSTSGTLAVAPSPVGLTIGGLLLALLLGVGSSPLRLPERLFASGVALTAGLSAGQLLLKPGFPYSHDGGTHLWGLHAISRAWGDNLIPPLWIPDLGLGMPLLAHYGVLSYLPGLIGIKAGLPTYDAFKLSLLLSLVASSYTMYRAAWRVTGSRGAAVLGATAFAYAPYHLLDTHTRGALGEAMALIAFPVLLEAAFSFARLGAHFRSAGDGQAREPDRRVGASGRVLLAVLWLGLVHPVSLFVAGVGAALLVLLWWLQGEEPLARTFAWILPALAGMGLAGAWLLPAVAELGWTSVPALFHTPPPSFGEHGLSVMQLVSRTLWYGRLPSVPAGEELSGQSLEMPFYFGLALGMGALGLAITIRRNGPDGDDRRIALSWLGLMLVSLAMTLLPAARLLAAWPGFPEVRYPWRFLGISSAAASFCLALLLARAERVYQGPSWQYRALAAAGLGLLLIDGAPFTGAPDWVAPYEGVVHHPRDRALEARNPLFMHSARPVSVDFAADEEAGVAGLEFPPSRPELAVRQVMGIFNEYLSPAVAHWLAPSGAADAPADLSAAAARAGARWRFTRYQERPLELRPPDGMEPASSPTSVPGATLARVGGNVLQITLPADTPAGEIVVREQASPGWRVHRASRPGVPAEATESGLLQIPVGGGAEVLELRYGATPTRRAGLILSALTLILLSLALVRGRSLEAKVESGWTALRARVQEVPEIPRDLLGLTLLGAVALGFRLWEGSLENGTDAIYATAIQHLAREHHWLAPEVHGVPYLMKPPLYFWIGALSVQALGAPGTAVSELALRLPSLLGALAGVVGTFLLGRSLRNRRTGWVAAGLLLGCAPYLEYARRVYMDPLLAGLTVLSVLSLLHLLERPGRFWLAGLTTGLAIFTKSYAGAFGAAAVLGTLLLGRREVLLQAGPVRRALVRAGVLSLLPLSAWIGLELILHPADFLDQNLAVFRLQSEAQFSWHPYERGFYVLEMLRRAPLFTLLAAVGMGLAALQLRGQNRRWGVVLLWLLGPLLLYWNLNQQRLYYLLPMLPAAALLAGLSLERLHISARSLALLLVLGWSISASPLVARSGPHLNPTPGFRSLAMQARDLLPEAIPIYVWNDFFAAPELYFQRPAIQWTPSRSLADEIGRILVVGELGIVEHVPAPSGLWQRFLEHRRRGTALVLLISEGELSRLAPGLVGAVSVAVAEGWHLVVLPTDALRKTSALKRVDSLETLVRAPVDSYLAAATFLAEQDDRSAAAAVCRNLAKQHPEVAPRALELAEQLER